MEDIGVAAVSLKAFPVDAEKVIKDIKKKITLKKISQDFKDVEEDVSLKEENDTGMNTPWPASTDFEFQIPEDKKVKIIKTPT